MLIEFMRRGRVVGGDGIPLGGVASLACRQVRETGSRILDDGGSWRLAGGLWLVWLFHLPACAK